MDIDLEKTLIEEGYTNLKEIDGKVYGLSRFIFTVALVINLDCVGYSGRYCYENMSDAKLALKLWDGKGDPSGPWIKYKGRPCERSNPNLNSNKIMTYE